MYGWKGGREGGLELGEGRGERGEGRGERGGASRVDQICTKQKRVLRRLMIRSDEQDDDVPGA